MRACLKALGLALILSSAGGVANAAWYKAETKHFVVYGEGSQQALKTYAEKLEAFDWLLRTFHKPVQSDAPRKLDVYLVESSYELQRVFPNRNADGVYSAGDKAIFAIAAKAVGAEGDDLLFHEYVHHFMLQYFPYSYPAWLVEGWAEYFQTADIQGEQIDIGRASTDMGWTFYSDDMLSLRSVIGNTSGWLSWEFYAWSWLLTHYMLSDPERKSRLNTYLRAVSAGDDPAKALETVMGMDARALTLRLRGYAAHEMKFTRIKGIRPSDTEVTISELSPAADDLLLEAQRLKLTLKREDGVALLGRVREKATKYPGDRIADFALARAEILYGDRAAGEAIAGRYLQANAGDLEALGLMAESRLASADAVEDPTAARAYRAEARKYLSKAFAIDANDYRTLYAYGRSQKGDPGYPSDNTLNVLVLSHQLAPQVAGIRLTTAEALMLRERYAEAAQMLAPLANSVHWGSDTEAARKLLDEIKKRQEAKS